MNKITITVKGLNINDNTCVTFEFNDFLDLMKKVKGQPFNSSFKQKLKLCGVRFSKGITYFTETNFTYDFYYNYKGFLYKVSYTVDMPKCNIPYNREKYHQFDAKRFLDLQIKKKNQQLKNLHQRIKQYKVLYNITNPKYRYYLNDGVYVIPVKKDVCYFDDPRYIYIDSKTDTLILLNWSVKGKIYEKITQEQLEALEIPLKEYFTPRMMDIDKGTIYKIKKILGFDVEDYLENDINFTLTTILKQKEKNLQDKMNILYDVKVSKEEKVSTIKTIVDELNTLTNNLDLGSVVFSNKFEGK